MLKAINEIKGSLKLIDIVIEVVDSRLPLSSRNHMIDDVIKDKERIIVMNKCDLADEYKLKIWKKFYEEKGYVVIYTNAKESEGINKIISEIRKIGEKIYLKKNENKSISIKPVYKVAVVGIPNVGKSTIINKLSNKTSALVSNRPGVTKKNQWIKLADDVQLMDTPGILWPNLEENNAGVKLALTGNIKQEVLDVPSLAIEGIKILTLNEGYTKMLKERYKLSDEDINLEVYEILEKIGKNRGCIISKGEIDLERTASIFLDEFKNGKICKVVLDEINVSK